MPAPFLARSWPAFPALAALAYISIPAKADTQTVRVALVDEECVNKLLKEESAKIVPSAGQTLRRHGIVGKLMAQDYWFDMMEGERMVQDMVCVYNKKKQEFHTAVRLGRDVCGYPKTVHGGLTAAVSDECFGGLYVSLWASGSLGWRPPGLTARLEVDYKRPLPADTVMICTAKLQEVSGRKVWMVSTVQDGATGVECATARALFVAPRWSRVMKSLVPWGRKQ